ncbi:hypothetical protein INT44_001212 [Umbelopsis vinacea]|uniref:dihydroxy-acid dehydratase n=1 Tax=Umbelopsis vinacea TaxID=44442 RepID=A0A8H7Q8P5_9FUNG|nr:hypothetical protein INT44_001212 [Umbelopsis vinacea]
MASILRAGRSLASSNIHSSATKAAVIGARHYASSSSSNVMNKYSRNITEPKSQGASQAMLYATGLDDEGLKKAQVGISSVWYEGNPCNMHLLDLAQKVKEGVEKAGLIGYRFNTVGVSDGISMGTDGMRFSLQSRDLIADSIETVMGGQWYDGNISLPGCDKNMPGVLMAMGRLNRPSLMVYGGSIRPGKGCGGNTLDIVSAFQAYGEYVAGNINEEQRYDIIRNACPGAGACGGMYTANTLASAIEAMGMTLPYSSSAPATSKEKIDECLQAGEAMRNLLEKDIKPRDILTRTAFENAMVLTMVLGGSTNAVLHFIAIARSVGINLTLDDFQAVSDRTPLLADLKPSGKYVMEDVHKVGGIPAILKFLIEEKMVDGDVMTVTGKSLAENLHSLPGLPHGQDVIKPLSTPIKTSGHLQILYGNLAPEGSVAKITGKEGLKFKGKARVFNTEAAFIEALENKEFKKGEKVTCILRYEGPQGGPGMPEMLKPTSAMMGAGLGQDMALLTDGRFSGGSHGFIIGHITPEAQLGGPIALIQDGDMVTIDAESNELSFDVSDAELEKRRKNWTAPAFKVNSGTLYKYIKNVKTASEGCVTDE